MSRSDPPPVPLSIWIVNPFDDLPGEGLPPQRCWSLARVLGDRGHDVTWWSATWSDRRKATREIPRTVREDENFAVRLVAVRPYAADTALSRAASHRDFGRTFERLASEAVASGQLDRPDLIIGSMTPLEGAEAAGRLAGRLDAAFVCDIVNDWPTTFGRLLPGRPWLQRLLVPLSRGGALARRDAVLTSADAISAQSSSLLDLDALKPSGEHVPPTHVCHLGAYLQEFPAAPRPSPSEIDASRNTAGGAARPITCMVPASPADGRDLDAAAVVARLLGTAAELHVATGESLDAGQPASARGPGAPVVHGPLPRRAYLELLARADAGIILGGSASPATTNDAVCDFAAAGLALVNASASGDIDRLVTAYGAGINVPVGDPASIAAAVKALANERAALQSCRQGSRRLAEAVFDREKTYLEYAEWLESRCHA